MATFIRDSVETAHRKTLQQLAAVEIIMNEPSDFTEAERKYHWVQLSSQMVTQAVGLLSFVAGPLEQPEHDELMEMVKKAVKLTTKDLNERAEKLADLQQTGGN